MRFVWAMILLLTCGLEARAGVVRTLDGKTMDGELRFDKSGALTLTARNNPEPLKLTLSDILSVKFVLPAEPDPAAAAVNRWTGRDIGLVSSAGEAKFSGNTINVKASGSDLANNVDSMYFVSRVMEGDGQITVRVTGLQATDRKAMAGLMIRTNTDPASPYAAMMVYSGGNAAFQTRAKLTAAIASREVAGVTLGYLKLARQGNAVTGYYSGDGKTWDLIGSQTVSLAARVQAGLFTCAHSRNTFATAGFENLAMIAENGRDTMPAVVSVPRLPRGLILRDGSLIAGDFVTLNASVVRIRRGREGEMPIALTDVSQILFNPSRTAASRIPSGKIGAMQTTGQFWEGELSGMDGGRIKMASVLFGLRTFDQGEIHQIVIRAAKPASNFYEVRSQDGGILYADGLDIEKEHLLVKHRMAGVIKFSASDLTEIKAGPGRYSSLLEAKAVKIVPGDGLGKQVTFDTAIGGGTMSLLGTAAERGIGLAAGGAVTFELAGQYRWLAGRFGSSRENAPAGRLVVTGDGRELYRGPAAATADAANLGINLNGVKMLELKLEPLGAGAAEGEAAGLLADPMLVK